MGLNTFLKLLLHSWWIIALTTLLTAGSTLFFAAQQQPIYAGTTTIEVSPSPALDRADQIVDAINALDRRATLNTIARKVSSSSIQAQVAEKLHLSPAILGSAGLSAAVLPDTNLIEIRAQSAQPNLAADMANTVAQIIVGQAPVRLLKIDVIDLASPATAPIGAGLSRLLTLGVLFGLLIGIVAVLLLFAIRTVLKPGASADERAGSAGAHERLAWQELEAPAASPSYENGLVVDRE